MTQTAMQIKMAKLRAMRKPKKGGCNMPKCKAKQSMNGDGMMSDIIKKKLVKPVKKPLKPKQEGEGPKLDKVISAAKKAGAVVKKGAELAYKHRKAIAKGVSAASGLAAGLTGNETLGQISAISSALGEGAKRGRKRGGEDVKPQVEESPKAIEMEQAGVMQTRGTDPNNLNVVNTGELAAPVAYYPNASAAFTGSLTF